MKKYLILILLITLHVFFLANLQFIAWPEMLSFPYLLNNGFSLYQDMIHPYPPLLTIILSRAYLMFGYTADVLKVTTWIFILLNDLLIFNIVKTITKSSKPAFASLILYVLVQPVLEGNMMWPDLGFVPFVLCGVYLFVKGLTFSGKVRPYYWFVLAGLMFTLAAFVKQTAGLFMIVPILILFKQKELRSLKQFLIAPLFIGSLFLLKLYAIGDLEHFLNWTLSYPSSYWTKFPGYVDMVISSRELRTIAFLFAPLLLAFGRSLEKFKADHAAIFFGLMLIISFITIYPRFSFFHFQSALAFIAIISGFVVSRSKRYFMFTIGVWVIFILTLLPTYRLDWGGKVRFADTGEVHLTKMIEENVGESETLYLLGPHSAHYVYANRLPAKPWVDNFGWYFEVPGVQETVLAQWETSPPDYVLWTKPEDGLWYELGTYQPQHITAWISKNYIKVAELQKDIWLWKYAGM